MKELFESPGFDDFFLDEEQEVSKKSTCYLIFKQQQGQSVDEDENDLDDEEEAEFDHVVPSITFFQYINSYVNSYPNSLIYGVI